MKCDSTIDELKAQIQNLESQNRTLQSQQLEYLSLFNQGDISLFKWNNDTGWSTEYASKNVEDIFGYTAEEFIQNDINYSNIIYPDDLEEVYSEVEDALKNSIDYFTHKAYRVITKSGDIKWVLDNSYTIRDENNNVSHFIGTISDITHLKNYELNLEQLVKEKTEENISQKDILYRQSKFTTIGQTIQNIAHQWRQPLNHIGANLSKLEMLNETKYNLNEIQTIIENSNTSLEYMSNTINDFINYFSTNNVQKVFKVSEVIYESTRILRPQLQNSSIVLNLDIKDEFIEIYGYKNELIQVMLMILNNAKDAITLKNEKETVHGKIDIKLNTTKECVTISIKDNGEGIDENILSRIFEPYFTTKFKLQGTGIGLYMCKIIIEKDMNGLIDVTNSKNGATFNISLPFT